MRSTRRRRTTAVVPRSLLAGVSMGMGVIPLCISSGGCIGGDPSPVGIAPAMDFDAGGDAAPVGIHPAMDFDDDAGDAAPVGIIIVTDFDAGSDADPGDASSAPDASGMDR
jgi:hypothetical protein